MLCCNFLLHQRMLLFTSNSKCGIEHRNYHCTNSVPLSSNPCRLCYGLNHYGYNRWITGITVSLISYILSKEELSLKLPYLGMANYKLYAWTRSRILLVRSVPLWSWMFEFDVFPDRMWVHILWPAWEMLMAAPWPSSSLSLTTSWSLPSEYLILEK